MNFKLYCFLASFIVFFGRSLSAQISFEPYHSYVTGSSATALVLSDINSDGLTDVAVVTGAISQDTADYRLVIYLQSADGNLANPTTWYYPARQFSDGAVSLDAGDLNGDGRVDIAIASDDSLVIFYQQNAGTFNRKCIYIGYGTDAVKIGDLNQDGRMDLVVTQFNEPKIHVFYQDAGGNLNLTDYPCPESGMVRLEITDINNDSLNDLLLFSYGGYEHGLFYFLQNPDGSLGNPFSSGIGQSGAHNMAVGNLNNDSKPDIAVTAGGNYPASLELHMQQPTGFGFNPSVTLTAYDIPAQVCINDLNCDGKNEIIIAHEGWNAISYYEQDKDNNYSTYSLIENTYGNFFMNSMAVGDLNGDNRPDIAIASGHLIIHYNNSRPAVSDSLILRRVVFTDPFYRDYKYITRKADTLSPNIYITTDSVNIRHNFNQITGWVDTYAIRIGFLCNKYYNDTTLLGSVYTFWNDTLSIDTSIYYHHVDTLELHGIEDPELAGRIRMYPNPSHGMLQVVTMKLESSVEVTVYDPLGIKLFEFEAGSRSKYEIDLSGKPKGLYLVKFSRGSRMAFQKILLN